MVDRTRQARALARAARRFVCAVIDYARQLVRALTAAVARALARHAARVRTVNTLLVVRTPDQVPAAVRALGLDPRRTYALVTALPNAFAIDGVVVTKVVWFDGWDRGRHAAEVETFVRLCVLPKSAGLVREVHC